MHAAGMGWILDQCRLALQASFGLQERTMAARSLADTIAVAAAGYSSRGVAAISAEYADVGGQRCMTNWHGVSCGSAEDAAFVDAVAAHALEYDDVDRESSAHLSCVVAPVLMANNHRLQESEFLDAMLAAVSAAGAIAQWLGDDHYRRGWHSTSTIGTLAACVALARARGLSPSVTANALTLAASQLSGVQANFGTDTKALHAGFAAIAALRSVRLASLGLAGSAEVFEHRSFLGNYGSSPRDEADQAGSVQPLVNRLLIKLYPCCFAIHRAIDAAFAAKLALGNRVFAPDARFTVTLPHGAFAILMRDIPQTSAQAAFSASYCCAVAMIDGCLELRHFDEEFPKVSALELAQRFEVRAGGAASADVLSGGRVTLNVEFAGGESYLFSQEALLGSQNRPPDPDHSRAKNRDCLNRYRRSFGREFPATGRVTHMPQVLALLN